MIPLLHPDWDAPASVRAFSTTRLGGVSKPPFDSLNLGVASGDRVELVTENRSRLRCLLPSEPGWIQQVHGRGVVTREGLPAGTEADALVCSTPGLACTILTADCLPVLFCNRRATRVAAAHAGWRGLVAGVLEATVAAMDDEPGEILAWLGPGISARAYEIGPDLQEQVCAKYPEAVGAFRRSGGALFADLYTIARLALKGAGLRRLHGGDYCTYTDHERFFSYRRDGRTGRMATAVWLD